MPVQPCKKDIGVQVKTSLAAAIDEYGACASAALSVLGGLFVLPPEDALLACGVGIRFGGFQGAAHSSFVGCAQFIAFAARKAGLSLRDILPLCESWRLRYEAYRNALPQSNRDEQDLAAEVLILAYGFLEENQHTLGLAAQPAKPKQYYDGIYADREAMFRHSPYALEERLSAAVTKGDGAAALAALRQITASGDKAVLAKDPLRSAKNSMIGSIAFLARAAIQAGVSANDAFALSDALTRQVEEMTGRSAVLAFEEHILLQFITLVRRRLDAAYSAPIVKVMHYIENHLDAKLSLGDAAAYAGVHPAYLSARFKRECGMSFTAYAAMRKIQESSYFVRHTGYPISQIASLYGFSSQSYYISTFKKVLGMTPIEYRRRLLAE